MASLVVRYLSLKPETPKKDYWDYGLLYDLLADFPSIEVDSLPEAKRGIVVLPARHHADMISEVNRELSKIDNVLLFLMGDEEGDFPIEQLQHPNIKIWVQNPEPDRHDKYRKLGTGYPPQIHQYKPSDVPSRFHNWFFAGQMTHSRRMELDEQLKNMHDGIFYPTQGFTQGLGHQDYYNLMSTSKIAPCPSGPITPDTFRLFEALELGAVPIADTQTPQEDWEGFWEWLFDGPVPFPTIKNWESLPSYVEQAVAQYPMLNNRVQAWWQRSKRKMKDNVYEDLRALGCQVDTENITVVIPVSPIPSHPGTRILEETLQSVRFHLPHSPVIVTFDGVRKEQENRRPDYEEHIRRILWDHDIIPYIFDEHKHQIGMMRAVIDDIKTPLILYMEQDTPLVLDEPIEWPKIMKKVLSGESNMVRFSFEAGILDDHRHMMLDAGPVDGFVRTAQWSQRPHVASTAFYRRMMAENFSPKAKCFIEDLAHGKLHQAYVIDGEQGWNQWRVHIYHPDGQIKRCYHTDGREHTPKYDDTQLW